MIMLSILLIICITLAVSMLRATPAYAHGYVETPQSRVIRYRQNSEMIGSAAWEPQSMEALKGFPQAGPPDGRLASANCARGCPQLDQQTSSMWAKTNIYGGRNTITWYYTAPHVTTKWEYWITRSGWNQNAPLTRASFDTLPFATIQGNNQRPCSGSCRASHDINIPTDRSGYHIIYAVWTVGDTVNAFYNVIDINLINEGTTTPPPPVGPSAPTNLHTMSVASDLVHLMWTPVSDAVRYEIYRGSSAANMSLLANTTTDSFMDYSVSPGASYQYHVVAVDGQGSQSSPSSTVTVNVPGETLPPFEVSGLHTMSVTANQVDLMWNISQGIVRIDVYRGESTNAMNLIGSSAAGRYLDNSVLPGRDYYYYVKGVNGGELYTAPSNTIYVNTPGETVVTPPSNILGAPTNVTVSGATTTSLTVHWNAPADTSQIMSYEIFRSGTKVGEVPVGILSYTDTGLTPNTTYSYTIRSRAVSQNSNTVTGSTTSAGGGTPPTNIPQWSASVAYLRGTQVAYMGNIYEALINAFGERFRPDLSPNSWRLIGPL
jgi:chitin-binding protein